MRGYKIIQQNEKWQFILIPNNNSKQSVGWSKPYDSYSMCKQGVQFFRELIIENQILSLDSPFVRTVKGKTGIYFEYCMENEAVFQSREYRSSSPITACKKSVFSIYRHIDGYTLMQIQ